MVLDCVASSTVVLSLSFSSVSFVGIGAYYLNTEIWFAFGLLSNLCYLNIQLVIHIHCVRPNRNQILNQFWLALIYPQRMRITHWTRSLWEGHCWKFFMPYIHVGRMKFSVSHFRSRALIKSFTLLRLSTNLHAVKMLTLCKFLLSRVFINFLECAVCSLSIYAFMWQSHFTWVFIVNSSCSWLSASSRNEAIWAGMSLLEYDIRLLRMNCFHFIEAVKLKRYSLHPSPDFCLGCSRERNSCCLLVLLARGAV